MFFLHYFATMTSKIINIRDYICGYCNAVTRSAMNFIGNKYEAMFQNLYIVIKSASKKHASSYKTKTSSSLLKYL